MEVDALGRRDVAVWLSYDFKDFSKKLQQASVAYSPAGFAGLMGTYGRMERPLVKLDAESIIKVNMPVLP